MTVLPVMPAENISESLPKMNPHAPAAARLPERATDPHRRRSLSSVHSTNAMLPATAAFVRSVQRQAAVEVARLGEPHDDAATDRAS